MRDIPYPAMKFFQRKVAEMIAADFPEVAAHRSGGRPGSAKSKRRGCIWLLVTKLNVSAAMTDKEVYRHWKNDLQPRLIDALRKLADTFPTVKEPGVRFPRGFEYDVEVDAAFAALICTE